MENEEVMDISQLVPDDHNFNRGTEEGAKLMQKSFTELGAGRSILLDRDNRIIAGNKSQKAASEAGITRVRINEAEIKSVSTFPQDYQSPYKDIGWLCGMSVPPVMTAQVAYQIYKQWLIKIK